MRACGIEIRANELVLCLLSLDRGLFEAPQIRQQRINIANSDDPRQLRAFQQTVCKFFEDYKVDKVAIKARPQKGKFAGSASGFKLEAILQLIESPKCRLIKATVIKETLKYHPLPIDYKETGLKAFQEQAFLVAYTLLVGPRQPAEKPVIAPDEEATTATDGSKATSTVYGDRKKASPEFKPTQSKAKYSPEKTEKKSAPPVLEPEPEPEPEKENPWNSRRKKP